MDITLQIQSVGKTALIEDVVRSVFADYRAIARENRARLLALALDVLGLETRPEIDSAVATSLPPLSRTHTYRAFHPPATYSPEDIKEAVKWCDLTHIPSWFSIPRIPPRGSPVLTSPRLAGMPLGALDHSRVRLTHPRYLKNTRDVVMYDVVLSNDTVVIYMGCVPTNNPDGVPRVSGPQKKILVYNPDGVEWIGTDPNRYNAFASDAVCTFDINVQCNNRFITWENPELDVNRNVSASYVFYDQPSTIETRYGRFPRDTHTIGAVPYQALTPVLVRVSAYDPLELATMPTDPKSRFSSAHVCAYKPL
jgi:hypothetical protein